jgi:hypothetical protein
MALRFLATQLGRMVMLASAIAVMPVAAMSQDLGARSRQQKKLPDAPAKLPKAGTDKT